MCVCVCVCVQGSVLHIFHMHILTLFLDFVTTKAEEETKGSSSAGESVHAVQSSHRQPSEPRPSTQEPPESQEQGQRGRSQETFTVITLMI